MIGRGQFRETGKVRTLLWCHDCGKDFEALLDYDLDGNHVINCPHCDHEHCRVIKAGVVTDDRWGQRNGPTHTYTAALGSVFTTIVTTSNTSSTVFLAQLWAGTSN